MAFTITQKVWKNGAVRFSSMVLGMLIVIALSARFLGTVDPSAMDGSVMNVSPGHSGEFMLLDGSSVQHKFWMGADSFGRDIWSRVIYGTRISLIVGVTVSICAIALGTFIGLLAGYIRWLDGVVMRVMDGLMAIPGILLAITLVAVWKASLFTVIAAIVIPEIPRVTRLVRSLVLSIREEPYVEAAVSLGTPTWKILWRHILPNAIAPLIVQGTYVCASAILLEAILSFLGVGLPPEIPTWGNIMAEGRVQFNQYPHNVFFPGIFLGLTVLAVNLLGDGLRDTLDPKFNKRGVK
jgi:peptide/nickel transport system permease protein